MLKDPRNEILLRQLSTELAYLKNMERPLKARDLTQSISTDKLIEIMEWAAKGLAIQVIYEKQNANQ